MAVRRGRPRVLNEEVIRRTLLCYAQEIVTGQGKIISKHNEIWTIISKEIGHLQPHALYTLVVNDRFNIKSTLLEETFGSKSEVNKDLSKTSSSDASTANSSSSTLFPSDEEPERTSLLHDKIDVIFKRNECDNLIETKQYARTEKKDAS